MEIELLPSRKSKDQKSRRNFFKNNIKIAVGLSLGSSLWTVSCKKEINENSTIWDILTNDLDGELLVPSSSSYDQFSSAWQLRFKDTAPQPQGIAMCISEEDVVKCILWANKNKIPFVARSGGHSYAAYSNSSGLIIHLSKMNKMKLDVVNNQLVLEGGAKNIDVFKYCKPFNRVITHGRCLEVGVSGLVLGGGIGFDMRHNGYTCDKLIETRVILADGSILTCNELENSDLFWACRGAGGGNFGIHTSFTFKTFEVGNITVFDLKWSNNIEELFVKIQDIVINSNNKLGLKFSVVVENEDGKNKLSLKLLGQWLGTKSEFDNLIAPIFLIEEPTQSIVYETNYWDGQNFISVEGEKEYSHERSNFISGQLSIDAIRTIISNLNNWPQTNKSAQWKYFLLGGEIDKKLITDMSFIHRGYTMLSSIDLEWDENDTDSNITLNEQWSNKFHNEMSPYISNASYQNFMDPQLNNYLESYYGSALTQLKEVKRKFDPNNIFKYPHSIPL